MEIPSRLIGEDQLRTKDHRAGDSHKLLLAAGELVREKIFLAHDVKSVEGVANQANAFLVRHVLVGERDLQIFENGQIVDEVITLKHKANVRFMQFVTLLDVELEIGRASCRERV